MGSCHSDSHNDKAIPLMPLEEKLKCINVKEILRYHVPNASRIAESHAHRFFHSSHLGLRMI